MRFARYFRVALVAAVSAWVVAASAVDYITYAPIDESVDIQLFVVPPGVYLHLTNAIPGARFYVYAPQANSGDISCVLSDTQERVLNLHAVKSSSDDGTVAIGVKALRPIRGVAIGTSADAMATDPMVHRILNFYVPRLEYCLDAKRTKIITDSNMSETKLKSGDKIAIYVRAVVPEGGRTNETEKLTKTFYINPEGASKNLKFLDMAGSPLPKGTKGYELEFKDGLASFQVACDKYVTDDSTFYLDAFPDPADDSVFLLHDGFPGGLRFEQPPVVSNVVALVAGSTNVYDGAGHGVTVKVTKPAVGATVRYAVGNAPGKWRGVAPLFMDVCEETVWVEVSAANYAPVTNSVTVKITKAANAWIAVPSISGWTCGETASMPNMGKAKFGTVAVRYGASGAVLPSSAGNYVATFTVAGTANYAGLTKEVPFTVEPAQGQGGNEPSGGGEEAPVKEDFFAGTVDTQFTAKQTLSGALCDAKGSVVGSVTLKFGKKNKKGVVKLSASATVIMDGKAKKVGAKAVSFIAGEWGNALSIGFKQPVGGMTLVPAADGMFALGSERYAMTGLAVKAETGVKRAVVVGGNLTNGAMVFSVDFRGLPELEGCLESALPVKVDILVSGGKKFVVGKAAVPKFSKDKTTGMYSLVGLDDPAKPNLSGLKLKYAPKTGLFSGSFKLYAITGSDRSKLKKFSVKVVGLIVDGEGVGWATLKKPHAEWPVTVKLLNSNRCGSINLL